MTERHLAAQTTRHIRSYVLRQKHLTLPQARALEQQWSHYGMPADVVLDAERVFGRRAGLKLEIGFGNGDHLLGRAVAAPQDDFIGIEVWLPGIGSLLRRAVAAERRNLRVVRGDAHEYLSQCVPEGCLETVWVLFPDPWPKRKHHKRRLVNSEFLTLLAAKMKPDAPVYLATDWADYAEGMRAAATANPYFEIVDKTDPRPQATRFEQRGTLASRTIFNLTLRRL